MKTLKPAYATLCLLAVAGISGNAQTVSNLTITPAPAYAVVVGVPLQFHAAATFTDGTIQDVTGIATWTSDNAAVATVDAAGAASGKSPGTANITAAFGTRTAVAVLNVKNFISAAPSAVATVAVGGNPVAAAVNPITGTVYVANAATNNVTAIDGATYAAVSIAAGTSPSGIAVDPNANRIYVANRGSNNVTVIDGSTNATSTVTAGEGPQAIVLNPVTGRIYVANAASITVIDGKTLAASPFATTPDLQSIAVNPVNGRVYAGYLAAGVGGVLVFDGATGTQLAAVPIPGGAMVHTLTVNTAANQIYAASLLSGLMTLIDGTTNSVSQPVTATLVRSVAVNPVLNKVVLAATNIAVFDPATSTASIILSNDNAPAYTIAAINPVSNLGYLVSARTNTVVVLDGAAGYNIVTSIPVGRDPVAEALDPVRNKVYVVNSSDNTVTVIDGATNTAAPLATGGRPQAVAVNPLTGKVYVVNSPGNDVTVTDPATGVSTTVPAGTSPAAVDIDPVANRVFVANSGSNDVTVIDGASDAAGTLSAGPSPIGVAVNPQTGKVYVANSGNGTVSVIDEATGASSAIPVGTLAANSLFFRMAVNQTTNRIYVPAAGAGALAVIDGATGTAAAVNVGGSPSAAAVNAVTNRIYLTNGTSSLVVVDGSTNAFTTVPLGFIPVDVAVNPFTNRVYALGDLATAGTVAVIDGASNQSLPLTLPFSNLTAALAVDPVTNKIYAGSASGTPNNGVISLDGATNMPLLIGNTAAAGLVRATALSLDPVTHRVYAVSPVSGSRGSVIVEETGGPGPINLAIGPLSGNRTAAPMPAFTITAAAAAGTLAVENVFFRFDTRAGEWSTATRNGDGTFGVAPAAPLQPGLHVLLAFATNGQAGTLTGTGIGIGNAESPLVSMATAYAFFVAPARNTAPALTGITVSGPADALLVGASANFTATGRYSDGSQRDITAAVVWTSSNSAVARIAPSGLATAASAGTATIAASAGGLSGSALLTAVNPMTSLGVTGSVAPLTGAGWVATFVFTNRGNVTLTGVTVAKALLNNIAPSSPLLLAAQSLAPGASFQISATFPASAGAPGSRANLQVQGAYVAVLPGTTQPGAFTSGFRIALP